MAAGQRERQDRILEDLDLHLECNGMGWHKHYQSLGQMQTHIPHQEYFEVHFYVGLAISRFERILREENIFDLPLVAVHQVSLVC